MKPYGLTPDVIADLYEAAIDDERWPHLSNIISKVTGVDAVVVWMIDNGVVSDMSVTANIRETPAPYVAHYGRLDPWQRAMLASPVDQPMISAEHVSERDLVKTEFYNDFARPAGLFRPMGVKLNLSPGMIGMVGIEQPATRKPFEPDDKRRIQPLLPHVKRALQLRLRNRQRASRADIRASALDALAFGVVVCNAMGRIAFVNAAAQALAHAGAGITLGGRKKGLGAIVPAESLTLASLIHDAAGGGAGGVLQLTGRDDMTALLILVTPLPRNLRGNSGEAMRSSHCVRPTTAPRLPRRR